MIGSLLVIDFPDRDAARRWQLDEPFTRAGIYATSSVIAFSTFEAAVPLL